MASLFDGYTNPVSSGEFTTVGDYLNLALNIAFAAGVSISLISIIMSGIKYITSRGDVKAAMAAKSALTSSIIALVLVVTAYTIVAIVSNFLTGQAAPTAPNSSPWGTTVI